MKNAKLFDKLRKLLDDANDADKKHLKKIRKVLHKLKKRQIELRESLDDIDTLPERQKIEQEIAVITLQRGKGVEIYKQLKLARKAKKHGESTRTESTGEKPSDIR